MAGPDESDSYEIFRRLVRLDARGREAALAELFPDPCPLLDRVRGLLEADLQADCDDFLATPNQNVFLTIAANLKGETPGGGPPESTVDLAGVPSAEGEGGASTLEPVVEPITHAGPAMPGDRIGRYRLVGILGQGGFGVVHRAHDTRLLRDVAIKVPRPGQELRPADLAAFERESRVLASLQHPNIVEIYDLIEMERGRVAIVTRLIDGEPLSDVIGRERPGLRWSAEILAAVARALHHAHGRDIVHRDVKPSNILVERSGHPILTDFGLSHRYDPTGTLPRIAGTPHYMSPEQASGESHLVDGRSDIFSLGVVFYELLTGRRPFEVQSLREQLAVIARADVRPPRQIRDGIPKVLERICLRALARRMSDRYTTALDMAEDLEAFLARQPDAPGVAREGGAAGGEGDPVTSPPEPAPIVPKGLRSYDHHDKDFFLRLLPGPRGGDGLPECVRFWTRKIEDRSRGRTFRVGLLYGSSGCGKSSLMHAGVLPLLEAAVDVLTVESSPSGVEAALLERLEEILRPAPPPPDLAGAALAARNVRAAEGGRKLLIVLDQFEQWLDGNQGEAQEGLVSALRQCDGPHLQAVLIVRDDYWLQATVFLKKLEIAIHSGVNAMGLGPFEAPHARHVLAAFGRAYSALPEREDDLDAAQRAFLDDAVAGLRTASGVIPVHLALFCEMMKDGDWDSDALKQSGGIDGVGVAFLEKHFSPNHLNPERRSHEEAAASVLARLLPPATKQIKTAIVDEDGLRDASGYRDAPEHFDRLVAILEGELRLIKNVSRGVAAPDDAAGGPRQYQLVHDYLIVPIRLWLRRRRAETAAGRATALLEERTQQWRIGQQDRFLPSLLEWARIRAFTRPSRWAQSEAELMRRAARRHGLRLVALGVAALLLLATLARLDEDRNRSEARSRVGDVLAADPGQLPDAIRRLDGYRRWADPELTARIAQGGGRKGEILRARVALLGRDPQQVRPIAEQLFGGSLDEYVVARDALKAHRGLVVPALLGRLDDPTTPDLPFLLSASCLASYEPSHERLPGLMDRAVRAFVRLPQSEQGDWIRPMGVLGEGAASRFRTIAADEDAPESHRVTAARWLVEQDATKSDPIISLLLRSTPTMFEWIWPVVSADPRAYIERLSSYLENEDRADLGPVVGDFDGDRIDELLIFDDGIPQIVDLPGKLTPVRLDRRIVGCNLIAGDIDGDGFDDLIGSGEGSTGLVVCLADGAGGFADALPGGPTLPGPVACWAAADLDGDRKHDLAVIARNDPRRIHVLLSKGKGEFAPAGVWYEGDDLMGSALRVADFDSDGRDDLAIFRLPARGFRIACNRGGGFKLTRPNEGLCRMDEAPAVGDFDFDGRPDVAAIGRNLTGRVFYFRGSERLDGEGLPVLEDGLATLELGFAIGGEHPLTGRFNDDPHADFACYEGGISDRIELLITEGRTYRRISEGPGAARLGRRDMARARSVIALMKLEPRGDHFKRLRHARIPDLRTELIAGFRRFRCDEPAFFRALVAVLRTPPRGPSGVPAADHRVLFDEELSVVRGILDVIWTYEPSQIPSEPRRELLTLCKALFSEHDDAGIHAAARAVLQRLGESAWVLNREKALARAPHPAGRRWSVNVEGQSFSIVAPGSMITEVGRSPDRDPLFAEDSAPEGVSIARRFAIGMTEVSVSEFTRFRREADYVPTYAPTPDCPINRASFFLAAQYCNRLSELEGLPKDQYCYVPNDAGVFDEGMSVAPNFLDRTGYRLPTPAEWEIAARAGAVGQRPFGTSDSYIGHFAWFAENSQDRSHPCGTLLPNELGLFDTYGNVAEWTTLPLDRWSRSSYERIGVFDRVERSFFIKKNEFVVTRGGAFSVGRRYVSAFIDSNYQASSREGGCGFRLARTIR